MSGKTTEQSWKLTLPCTRAEAEAIDAADDLGITPPPVLMTTEEVEDDIEHWRLDAYFEGEPDEATIAAIRALVPSSQRVTAVAELVEDEDWVTMSQSGLEPVRAGRFVVHTSAFPIEAPVGGRAFLIEAAQAFGTGHHETTSGCLAMLDALAVEGRTYAKIIDLGTGTGLLAFAAIELWPMADVTATDIDPIAIDVTLENAVANTIAVGLDIGEVAVIVADGTQDPKIRERAPYDLVIANILAAPLIAMASDIAMIAAPGATIVLAGLLSVQADAVVAGYAAAGCTEVRRVPRGDWSILELRAA